MRARHQPSQQAVTHSTEPLKSCTRSPKSNLTVRNASFYRGSNTKLRLKRRFGRQRFGRQTPSASGSERTHSQAPSGPVLASPLTIKLGVRSLHFWWPLSQAGFCPSKPDLTPVNRPSPDFFPHSKPDFYETEGFIQRSAKARLERVMNRGVSHQQVPEAQGLVVSAYFGDGFRKSFRPSDLEVSS